MFYGRSAYDSPGGQITGSTDDDPACLHIGSPSNKLAKANNIGRRINAARVPAVFRS